MSVCAKMAMSERKVKKQNFTDCEIETLVGKIEARKNLVAIVIALPTKENVLSGNTYLLPALRAQPCRRWKRSGPTSVCAKKRIACYRQSVSATGGSMGLPGLSTVDEKMASIVGEASVADVVTKKESNTGMAEDDTPGEQPKALCVVHQT